MNIYRSSALSLSIILALILPNAYSQQPDWSARFREIAVNAEPNFTPPKEGSRIKIAPTIGGAKYGVLISLTQDRVVLNINGNEEVFERTKLSPDSRAELFSKDYARIIAQRQVAEEKRTYEAQQLLLAQERADEAVIQAKKRADEEAKKKELQLQAERAAAAQELASTQLVLMDWNWGKEYDYAVVKGQVGNISGTKLENVEAVVSFYAEDGTFITSDSALIEFNPLMPKQVSPFRVMERYNPMMNGASVTFKTIWGKTLISISKEKYDSAIK